MIGRLYPCAPDGAGPRGRSRSEPGWYSARGSRCPAWKNGPSSACLTIRFRLGCSERQPTIVVGHFCFGRIAQKERRNRSGRFQDRFSSERVSRGPEVAREPNPPVRSSQERVTGREHRQTAGTGAGRPRPREDRPFRGAADLAPAHQVHGAMRPGRSVSSKNESQPFRAAEALIRHLRKSRPDADPDFHRSAYHPSRSRRRDIRRRCVFRP